MPLSKGVAEVVMSLGVVIKGPEGVVLAADSRVTLQAQDPRGNIFPVTFDNATKLLSFSEPHNWVGAVTYGAAVIGLRTAHSFVPEFEVALRAQLGEDQEKRLSVLEFAKHLSNFYRDRWTEDMPSNYTGPDMTFIVGGFDKDAAYGSVYVFSVPHQLVPGARNPGEKDFGMTWGGQLEVATRLVHGHDPALMGILERTLSLTQDQMDAVEVALKRELPFRIPYNVLPLQDCVDLATFLIRTTMTALNLSVALRGVGGQIEVAHITREKGLQYVQRKEIHGEAVGNPHTEVPRR